MDLDLALEALFWVAAVSVLASLVTALLPGPRLPQVVFLLAGGVVIGPELLNLADPGAIEILSDLGLGFLFLLAGYELEPRLFRDRAGRLAMFAWGVSLVLALGVVGVAAALGVVEAYVPIALGLTTTALGTLLPILREHDLLQGSFGRYVLATGAVGEIFPVIAIALFLGARSEFVALLALLAVGLLAVALTLGLPVLRGTRLERTMREGEHNTAQTTIKATVLLLTLFLVTAEEVGLDVILGAFLAGMVLRTLTPRGTKTLEDKLDVIGYGYFIPIFFVCSGMQLDVISIVEEPGRLALFFVLFLIIRGLPCFVVFRSLAKRERLQIVFIASTTLPLLVALTQIGLANGTMLPANAAALVGAGALSVLVFPTIAVAIGGRRSESDPA